MAASAAKWIIDSKEHKKAFMILEGEQTEL